MKKENKIALVGTAVLAGLTIGTALVQDVNAEEITPQVVQQDKQWITINSIEFPDADFNSGVKHTQQDASYMVNGIIKVSGAKDLKAEQINLTSNKDYVSFGSIGVQDDNTLTFTMMLVVPNTIKGTDTFTINATGVNDALHNITPYSITDTLEIDEPTPEPDNTQEKDNSLVPTPNNNNGGHRHVDPTPLPEPQPEPETSTTDETSETTEPSQETTQSSQETTETTSSQSVSNVEQPTQETNKPLESSSDDTKKVENSVTVPVEQTEVKELPKTGSKTNKPLIVIGVILVVASLITLCYNEYTNRKGGK